MGRPSTEAGDYLAWKCRRIVSSEATIEMLQPTREMYVRGASNSAGTGAGDSCCGREEGLQARSMEMPSPCSEGPKKDLSSKPSSPTNPPWSWFAPLADTVASACSPLLPSQLLSPLSL